MQHSHEGLDRLGGFSRVNLLAPLRLRDFRLLWIGMTVSLVGDGIFFVAMAWQAYELWNAPAALSLIGVGMTVPTIAFLLPAGVLSDRLDRRSLMLCADVGRAVVIAVLATLALTGALTFWELIVVVALYGVGTAFFTPAFEAIVPDIVPAADLAAANSLDQFVRPIALRLAGPAVGGALVAGLDAGGVPDAPSGPSPIGPRPLVLERDQGGARVRPAPCLALGHPPLRRDCLPRVHGPDRGAAAVHRQERPARLRRRPRARVRRRWGRSDLRRADHGTAGPSGP